MAKKKRTPRANPQSTRRKILAAAGVEVTDELLKMPFDEFLAKFGEPERKPRRKKKSGQDSKGGGTKPVTVTVGDPEVPKAPPNVTPPDPKSEDKKPRTKRKPKKKNGGKSGGSKPLSTSKPDVEPPKSPPEPPKTPKKAPAANPLAAILGGGSEPTNKKKSPKSFFNKRAPKGQMGAMVAQQRQSPHNLSSTKSEVADWIGRVGQRVKSEASRTAREVNRIGRPQTKTTLGPMSQAGPQMTSARTSPRVPITRSGAQATNVRYGPRRGPKPRQSVPRPKYIYYPKALRVDPDSKKWHTQETARRTVGAIRGALNAGPAHGGPAGLGNLTRLDVPDQMRVTPRTAAGREERAAARTLRNKGAEPARRFAQLFTGKRAESRPLTGRIVVKRRSAKPVGNLPWRELPGLQPSGQTVTGAVIKKVGYSQLDDAPKSQGRNLPRKPRVSMTTTFGPMSSSPFSGIGVGTGPGSGSPSQPTTKTGKPKKTSYKPVTLGRMARADRPIPPAGGTTTTRPATPISPNTPTTRPSREPSMRYPGVLLYESPSGNFAMQTGKREVQFFTKGGNRPVISTPVSNKKGGSTTRVKANQLDLEKFAKDVVSDLEGEWSAKDMRGKTKGPLSSPSLSSLGRVARQVDAHNRIWGTPEARMGRRASTLNLNARGTYVEGESQRKPASGRSASLPRTYGGKASWVKALKKRGLLSLAGGATATGIGVVADVLMNPASASAPPTKNALAAEKKRRQKRAASLRRANRATQRAFPTFLDRIR